MSDFCVSYRIVYVMDIGKQLVVTSLLNHITRLKPITPHSVQKPDENNATATKYRSIIGYNVGFQQTNIRCYFVKSNFMGIFVRSRQPVQQNP